MTDPVTHAILSTKLEALETQVESLAKSVNDLLAIKHKALGMFWLGSIIVTAAFTAIVSAFSGWMRGH